MAAGDKVVIASKEYVNTEVALKADAATTYTKDETDAKITSTQSLNPIVASIIFGG